MLGRAEQVLARQRDHLAHVEMEVLAALGDDAVEAPERGIGEHQPEAGTLAPRRVHQRIEQTFDGCKDRCKHAASRRSATHRRVRSPGCCARAANGNAAPKYGNHRETPAPSRALPGGVRRHRNRIELVLRKGARVTSGHSSVGRLRPRRSRHVEFARISDERTSASNCALSVHALADLGAVHPTVDGCRHDPRPGKARQ